MRIVALHEFHIFELHLPTIIYIRIPESKVLQVLLGSVKVNQVFACSCERR
jgi:hypothetical protein